MSYHRLLERRFIDGRLREAGSLIDYRGPLAPWLEPLDVRAHGAWLDALRTGAFQPERRAA